MLAPQKTLSAMPLEGWRFGLGTGYALYVGDQMDFTLTKTEGDFKELRANFTLAAFKQLNEEKEFGLVAKFGSMQTLKSQNTQGIQCDFQELQAVWQRSLNDNIDLNGKRFTFNVQYGLGVMYYKSMYFQVSPNFPYINRSSIISTVGYGYNNRTDLMGKTKEDIAEKKLCLVGNVGFTIGAYINRNFSVYWENSFQISSSSKISGNLGKTALFPPDGYFYTGISAYYRIGRGGGRLLCPRTVF